MPRKKKSDVAPELQPATEPKIPKELLDQLITGPITQGEFETIFRALKKAVIERAMSAEMNAHLGYKHGEPKPAGQTNQRNGTSGKTVLTDDGSPLLFQNTQVRVRSCLGYLETTDQPAFFVPLDT
jgi:putative transposase